VHRLIRGVQRVVAELAAGLVDGEVVVQIQPLDRKRLQWRLRQAEPEMQPLPDGHRRVHQPPGNPHPRPVLAARLHHRSREFEHVDRVVVVDEIRLPRGGAALDEMLGGEDETLHQVVHVRVVKARMPTADQHLHLAGDHPLEHLAEHGLIPGAPDAARADRAGE